MANILASNLQGVHVRNFQVANAQNSRIPIQMSDLKIQPATISMLDQNVKKGTVSKDVMVTVGGTTQEDHGWVRQFALKNFITPRFPGKTITFEGGAHEYVYRIANCSVAQAAAAFAAPAKDGVPAFIQDSDSTLPQRLQDCGAAVQRHYNGMIDAIKERRDPEGATGWVDFQNTAQWDARVAELTAPKGKPGGAKAATAVR